MEKLALVHECGPAIPSGCKYLGQIIGLYSQMRLWNHTSTPVPQ